MAELPVPAEARDGVVPEPCCRDFRCERLPGALELPRVLAAERAARKPLEAVAVTLQHGCAERERMTDERRPQTQSRRTAQERRDAVAGRQRAVDVERRDDGSVAWRGGHEPNEAIHSIPVSDGPEIFDDLYLGLQAGGALRKQRRGEELTEQEREALGRWQQMSMWRKGVAIGAFAVGTFGLGFTLGGLVFGRWARKA